MIAHKTKTLSHEEAAALPLVGVSAWQALTEDSGLSRDKNILIHRGAGEIGSIAVQLALPEDSKVCRGLAYKVHVLSFSPCV